MENIQMGCSTLVLEYKKNVKPQNIELPWHLHVRNVTNEDIQSILVAWARLVQIKKYTGDSDFIPVIPVKPFISKRPTVITRLTVNSMMNMKLFYSFCEKLSEKYPETNVFFTNTRDKAMVMKRMTGYLMSNISNYTVKNNTEKMIELIELHKKHGVNIKHFTIFIDVLFNVISNNNFISDSEVFIFRKVFSKFIYLMKLV